MLLEHRRQGSGCHFDAFLPLSYYRADQKHYDASCAVHCLQAAPSHTMVPHNIETLDERRKIESKARDANNAFLALYMSTYPTRVRRALLARGSKEHKSCATATCRHSLGCFCYVLRRLPSPPFCPPSRSSIISLVC